MNNSSRRNFLLHTSIAAATTSLGIGCSTTYRTNQITNHRPVIISTWSFGKPANELALQTLQDGGSALDAVEQGIRLVESSGNSSVGLSGNPNAAGVPQLDACIMNGPGHRAGSVAGIEGVVHPITAARLVMEKTPHVMLVGRGARWFSEQQGLKTNVNAEEKNLYEAWQKKLNQNSLNKEINSDNLDTVTFIVIDKNGDSAGGCASSGLSGKIPGRVGDSPIIGSGLYVDNEVGAAGATGLGENVMRYCASYQVVENMRQGMSTTKACAEAIKRIARIDPLGSNLGINLIAINKRGEFGAAGTQANFPFSITTKDFSEVRKGQALSAAYQKEGGNER